jgi:hypothetical protein
VNGYIWKSIKNLSNAMKKVHEFHQQYPNKPSSFLVELVTRKGNDAIDVNAMKFIHMNVHP